MTIAVQVNGKVRAEILVDAGAGQAEVHASRQVGR